MSKEEKTKSALRQPEQVCGTCNDSGNELEFARACPECDCQEYVNENLLGEGYRACRECGQDWWLDVKYSIGKPCPDCRKGKKMDNTKEHKDSDLEFVKMVQFNIGNWIPAINKNDVRVRSIIDFLDKALACITRLVGEGKRQGEALTHFDEVIRGLDEVNERLQATVTTQAKRIEELEKALEDCMGYVDVDNLTMQTKERNWQAVLDGKDWDSSNIDIALPEREKEKL